jgi:protein SCO1/2
MRRHGEGIKRALRRLAKRIEAERIERMKFCRLLLVAAGALVLTVSCMQESVTSTTNAPPAPPANTNTQVFQVKGVVVELQADGKTVQIRHEAIPGYMDAMTMPFEVRDTNELRGLAAGDSVSFRMIVTDTDAWIDQVKKLNATANTNLPKAGPFRFVRDVEPLNIGDPLPDYRFTNQLGQAVHLHQFRGQALAITFIFTRCPYPTFCPLMSNNFRDAQEKLLNTPNAPTNWHLLTISFDPEYDTPARLKAYAQNYHCDPKRWSFLTGELIDITAIAEQFGQQFWRAKPNEPISHNLRTVVVDTQGRVQKIIPENKWTSDELVAEIVKATVINP